MNQHLQVFITNSRRIISCYKFNFLELFAVHVSFFEKLLLSWRKPVFLDEIDLAGITKKDNVLLIGCGIFPSETIIIAEATKASIIGIDNSINAVKLAKKYVKKQSKISDLVTIQYGDGTSYDLQSFNVIFVAINVFPIDNVLNHIARHAKKGTKILCKSIDNDIPQTIKQLKLENSFEIESMRENPKTQSYLLKKK